MSLADVEYQAPAQRLIQRAVQCERVHHAYLFHGPDGVGKETLAVGLAELLLCSRGVERTLEESEARAVGVERLRTGCGLCEQCRMVKAGTHPDLHSIYRQLNRLHPKPEVRKRKALDMGIDVLRYFVIERVGLTPVRGRTKVFIIREADRITPQAQNALLKTLEEPPGATVLILLVTALDRMLPTTLSRCQVVRFNALPMTFVRNKIAQQSDNMPAEQVDWYARVSEGSLGLALDRIKDDWFQLNQQVVGGLFQLSNEVARSADPSESKTPERLAKEWLEESKRLGTRYRKDDPDMTDTEAGRHGLKSILQLAAVWYADVLRCGEGGDRSTIVNSPRLVQIKQAAELITPRRAIRAINRLAQAERQLDFNVHAQLCVEALVSDLPSCGQYPVTPGGIPG